MKNLIKVLLVMNLLIWILTTALIFTAAFSKERLLPSHSSETASPILQEDSVGVGQFN